MAITYVATPSRLVWGIGDPYVLRFARKDGTFTSLTTDAGNFLLNGVSPAALANAPGWVGDAGDTLYCSPPGAVLRAALGGSSGTIKTSSTYYAAAGVGAGYFNVLKYAGNRVDVAVTYVSNTGVTETVTIPGYADRTGDIFVDLAEGAKKYTPDPLASDTLANGSTATGTLAYAQISLITYIEVLDADAPYTASPATPTTITGNNLYIIRGARRPFELPANAVGTAGWTPWSYGVGVVCRFAMPYGTPIFWQGTFGSVPVGIDYAIHSFSGAGGTQGVVISEALLAGGTNTTGQNFTRSRETKLFRYIPSASLASVTLSVTDATLGIAIAPVTCRVRQCLGNANERLLVRWGNSVGTTSYWVFDVGYTERSYIDSQTKFSKVQWGTAARAMDDKYARKYNSTSRTTVVERSARCMGMLAAEAEYLSDLLNADYIKVYDERSNAWISPDWELTMEKPYRAYDSYQHEATFTIRYPQTGLL